MTPIRDPIIGGMASIPARSHKLRVAVESILHQLNHLFVFLDNYIETPKFLKSKKVTVLTSQDYGQLGDRGKFLPLDLYKRGILFTLDDDLLYPSDYVARMVQSIQHFKRKAIVGVHGVVYPPCPLSFFDRSTKHFSKSTVYDTPVSLLGTGTVAFDLSQVHPQMSHFGARSMADLWLARWAKHHAVPMVALSRPGDWLIEQPSQSSNDNDSESIYQSAKSDSSFQDRFLIKESPWGSSPLLSAVENASIAHKFPPDIQVALMATKDMPLHQRANVLSRHPNRLRPHITFQRVQKHIDFLCTPDESQPFMQSCLEDMLHIRSVRKSALLRLKRSNPELALSYYKKAAAKGYLHQDEVLSLSSLARRMNQHPIAEGFLDDAILERAKSASTTVRTVSDKDVASERILLRYEQGDPTGALEAVSNLAEPEGLELYAAAALASSAIALGSKNRFGYLKEALLALARSPSSENSKRFVLPFADTGRNLRLDASFPNIFNWLPQSLPDRVNALISFVKVGRELNWPWMIERALLELGDAISESAGQKIISPLERGLLESFANRDTTALQEALNADYRSEGISSIVLAEQGSAPLFPASSDAASHFDGGPLVSIIMTTFNSEATVEFALDSIMAQSYRNFELIVVDDASSDQTVRKVRRRLHNVSGVEVLRRDTNGGPYAARNDALALARGTLIAIHDSDDLSHPERFSIQASSLEQNPTVQLVTSSQVRIDETGSLRLDNTGGLRGTGPMTMMFRRSLIEEIGPFVPVPTRGDMEFLSRVKHAFGAAAVHHERPILLFALDSGCSNSIVMRSTLERRRRLASFRRAFEYEHRRWAGKPAALKTAMYLSSFDFAGCQSIIDSEHLWHLGPKPSYEHH